MLNPEALRNGETGKSDISWLSWRKNTLGTKLHKETNALQELIVDDEQTSTNKHKQIDIIQNRLKSVNFLLKTANILQQSTQYLSWFVFFMRKIVFKVNKNFTYVYLFNFEKV